MPQVSLLATVVGALAGFVLGGIWYGPLFGKAWMAEHGYSEEELRKDFNPARTYGTMFVLSLLAAYVFGAFLGPEVTPAFGAAAGAAAGLFWVSGSIATNYLFERSSLRLWLINGGYHTVRFTLIGLAFGLLK
jgi:small-conductance mechanosensitive channel